MPRKLSKGITVYKSAEGEDGSMVVVRLRVPRGAWVNRELSRSEPLWLRRTAKKRKNRASRARVLDIRRKEDNTRVRAAHSHYSYAFRYVIGKVVEPVEAFEHTTRECASGIHFFESRQQAMDFRW